MGKMLTVAMLSEKRPCTRELALFQAMFPDGVEVTEDLRALHAKLFHFGWAARYLLSDAQLVEWAVYKADALKESRRIGNSALANVPNDADYKDWDTYSKICSSAFTDYKRNIARKFARLYNS